MISSACNKKELDQNSHSNQTHYKTTYLNPWNTNNPIDSIGFYHNQGLDFLVSNYNVKGLSKHQIANYTWEYLQTLSFVSDSTQVIFEQVIFFTDTVSMDNLKNYPNLPDSFSMNWYSFAQQILHLCNVDTNNIDSTFFKGVIDSIKIIEEVGYTEPYFTFVDSFALAVVGSVARHSWAYWFDIYIDDYSPWHKVFGKNSSIIKANIFPIPPDWYVRGVLWLHDHWQEDVDVLGPSLVGGVIAGGLGCLCWWGAAAGAAGALGAAITASSM